MVCGAVGAAREVSRGRVPVTLEHICELLSYLDPNAERPEWITIIAAIRSCPVEDDDDEAKRRQAAHDYSTGKLDMLARGIPSRYTSPGDVDAAFNTLPPKDGGAAYGSLYHAAVTAGYKGPPGQASAAAVFATALGRLATENPAKATADDPHDDSIVASDDELTTCFTNAHQHHLPRRGLGPLDGFRWPALDHIQDAGNLE